MEPQFSSPTTTADSAANGRLKVATGRASNLKKHQARKAHLKTVLKKDGMGGPGFLHNVGAAIKGGEAAVGNGIKDAAGAVGSVINKLMNKKAKAVVAPAVKKTPRPGSLDSYNDMLKKLDNNEY